MTTTIASTTTANTALQHPSTSLTQDPLSLTPTPPSNDGMQTLYPADNKDLTEKTTLKTNPSIAETAKPQERLIAVQQERLIAVQTEINNTVKNSNSSSSEDPDRLNNKINLVYFTF